MDPRAEKALYERLDAIVAALPWADELAEVVMVLTGTVVQDTESYTGPTLDPGLQADARKVALRWLRNHGHIPESTATWIPRVHP
jgi:hypothetical protein